MKQNMPQPIEVLVGQSLGDSRHCAKAFPSAAFEVRHLLYDVRCRQSREIGGFIVAGAGRQMAGAAGEC